MEPALSVVICTHNRSDDVAACLHSLRDRLPAPDRLSVETIVVDNNSTDATAETVEAFDGDLPGLRYVFEAEPGLSSARNRGIEEASAPVVAFLDDDATIRPGWAEALVRRFDDPTIVGVAGRILLSWPSGAAPRWYSRRMDGWFTQLDLGDEPLDLASGETPWGANMAVLRSAAEAVGGFRTDLGRIGASLLSGEERDFFLRTLDVAGRDHRLVYEPDAAVDHHVQPDRVSLRWVARRSFHNGRSLVITESVPGGGTTAAALEAARATARALARGWGTAASSIRRSDDPWREMAAELTDRCQPLGAAREHLRRARAAGSAG